MNGLVALFYVLVLPVLALVVIAWPLISVALFFTTLLAPLILPLPGVVWFLVKHKKRLRRQAINAVEGPSFLLRRIEFSDIFAGGWIVISIVAGMFVFRVIYGIPSGGSANLGWNDSLLLLQSAIFAHWWYRLWWNGVRNAWVYALSGWVATRLVWHLPDGIAPSFLDFYVEENVNILNGSGLESVAWLLGCAGVVLALVSAYKDDARYIGWAGLVLTVPFVTLSWMGQFGVSSRLTGDGLTVTYIFDAVYSLGMFSLAISNMNSEMGHQIAKMGNFRGVSSAVLSRRSAAGGMSILRVLTVALAVSVMVCGLWLVLRGVDVEPVWMNRTVWGVLLIAGVMMYALIGRDTDIDDMWSWGVLSLFLAVVTGVALSLLILMFVAPQLSVGGPLFVLMYMAVGLLLLAGGYFDFWRLRDGLPLVVSMIWFFASLTILSELYSASESLRLFYWLESSVALAVSFVVMFWVFGPDSYRRRGESRREEVGDEMAVGDANVLIV